jgi:peroxiredoxin Q/BCP
MLKEGDMAPDFTAVDHTGKEVSLSDLRGKKVWLWFYSSPGGGN